MISKKAPTRTFAGAVQERYCKIIAMRTKVEHDSSEVNLPKPSDTKLLVRSCGESRRQRPYNEVRWGYYRGGG